MNKLIGLHGIALNDGIRIGSARVGKDEVGKILADCGYYVTSFAKPIYKIARDFYGIDTAYLTDIDKDVIIYQPWEKTLRQILQDVGDMFRSKDPEFFIKAVMVDIQNNADDYQGVVITDVRYENEADFVRGAGGRIWHILREFKASDYMVINNHSSEQGIDICQKDFSLSNNGTLLELKDVVTSIVSNLKTFEQQLTLKL